MTNLEKYNEIFEECLGINLKEFGTEIKYQLISEWDSVGHMNLIATIEESFDILLDTEDIIEFTSYEGGKDILKKYNINVK